jgi:hypothetical protein
MPASGEPPAPDRTPPPEPVRPAEPAPWAAAAAAPQSLPAPPPAGPPGAAAAPRTALNGTVLLGGIVVVALVVVGGFFFLNSNGKPGPSNAATLGPSRSAVATVSAAAPSSAARGGSLVVTPAVVDCSKGNASATLTVVLPATVKADDTVSAEVDGQIQSTSAVSDSFTRQADGTWLETEAQNVSDLCAKMDSGQHVMRVLDANDNVLAQGTFALSGAISTATPFATTGTVTVDPGSFSCSGSSVPVTIAIQLPGSIPAEDTISVQLDGLTTYTDTVGSGFVMQDGNWLSSDTSSSADLCGSFDPGQHSITLVDSAGQVLADGSFTVMP